MSAAAATEVVELAVTRRTLTRPGPFAPGPLISRKARPQWVGLPYATAKCWQSGRTSTTVVGANYTLVIRRPRALSEYRQTALQARSQAAVHGVRSALGRRGDVLLLRSGVDRVPRLRRRTDSGRMTAPAPVSLSNRRETGSKSEPLGVDRLSFSFPVEDFERDETAWSSVSVRNPGAPSEHRTYGRSVGGVFVGVASNPGLRGAWIGKVEANPSRVIDPTGWEAIGVAQVFDAVDRMARVAADVVRLGCPLELARLKRLDVCRDFATDDPAAIVRGLGPVHRPWSRRNLVHFDPARGGAQTLMVGSGSGVVRLYDKHAETDGKAAEGTLRWEVEARSQWLQKYGHMVNLGDVTEDKVRELAEDRWSWSAMDRELSATEQIVEKVMRLDVSPTVKERLVGRLVMEQMGSAYPMAKATATKYRRMVKELGIALDPEASSAATRLDWETGRQITTVGF